MIRPTFWPLLFRYSTTSSRVSQEDPMAITTPVGLGVADVIEGLVAASGQVADLFHVVGHDARCFEIIGVAGFPALEIDVRVLSRAPQFGPFGVGAPGPEGRNGLSVDQFGPCRRSRSFRFSGFHETSGTRRKSAGKEHWPRWRQDGRRVPCPWLPGLSWRPAARSRSGARPMTSW